MARLQAEQRRQWLAGAGVKVEDLLAGHPEVAANEQAVLALIHS